MIRKNLSNKTHFPERLPNDEGRIAIFFSIQFHKGYRSFFGSCSDGAANILQANTIRKGK